MLKMGAEKEASQAAFANAKCKADSCVFIRLCSLNRGLEQVRVDQRGKQSALNQ